MKKIKAAPQNAKRVKSIIAAAMALTLAVPTTAYFSSKSSEVNAEGTAPTPLTTVTFDKGFAAEEEANGLHVVKSEDVLEFNEYKLPDGSYERNPDKSVINRLTDTPTIQADAYKYTIVGNQPVAAYDDTMGEYLQLDNTVAVEEFKKKADDAMTNVPQGTILQYATISQSQVQIDNPFAGADLSNGASVSYWVKVPKESENSSKGANSSLIVFGIKEDDNKKVKTEYAQAKQEEKDNEARLSIQISANNDFHYAKDNALVDKFDGDGAVLEQPEEWAFVTVAMTDSSVVTYVNGTATEHTINASGMMTDLADSNTGVFFGGNYSVAVEQTGQSPNTVFGVGLDDVSFYDKAVTAEEAAELYSAAQKSKETVEPVLLEKFSFENGTTGENGTELSADLDTNLDTDLTVVQDANDKMGNVLKLSWSEESSLTNGAKLATNPFAGKNLTGATVNYWVREPKDDLGIVNPSVSISFIDAPKNIYHEKMSADWQNKPGQTVLYTQTDMDAWFMEGYSTQAYQGLANKYQFSIKRNGILDESDSLYEPINLEKYQEYVEKLNTMSDWHMVTAVLTNAGIKMYYDGKLLTNNLASAGGQPSYYGPRFFDGYYAREYDGTAKFYYQTNNQLATPLMTFLSYEDTDAYIGYMYELGYNNLFKITYEAYYDDIAYYGNALTDDQIMKLYEEKGFVPSEEPPKEEDPGNDGPGGKVDGVDLPDGITLSVDYLDKVTDVAAYDAFKALIAESKDFVVKDLALYKFSASDPSFTLPADTNATLTFALPEGFDVSALVVLDENMKEYEYTLSDDKKQVVITGVNHFGNYGVVEKDMSTDDESTIAARNAYSGKTGDTANIVLPIVMLVVVSATLVVVSKKRRTEEE